MEAVKRKEMSFQKSLTVDDTAFFLLILWKECRLSKQNKMNGPKAIEPLYVPQ
jgi:hypothetical protein